MGMPPPPAQMTTAPRSISQEIGCDLQDLARLGGRHHPPPSGAVLLERPAFLRGQRVGGLLGVDRADELGRAGEGRVIGVHGDHGEQGGHLPVRRQQATQFLLDQVADDALGARVQDVQRVRLGVVVGLGLQRQQAHLRAVAVHDHDAVLGGQRRDRLGRDPDVPALDLGGHGVAPAQQRIAAQRDHDPHLRPSPSSLGPRRPAVTRDRRLARPGSSRCPDPVRAVPEYRHPSQGDSGYLPRCCDVPGSTAMVKAAGTCRRGSVLGVFSGCLPSVSRWSPGNLPGPGPPGYRTRGRRSGTR